MERESCALKETMASRFRFRCRHFYSGTLVLLKDRNSLRDSLLLKFSQPPYHVKDNSEPVGIIHRFNGFGVVVSAPWERWPL